MQNPMHRSRPSRNQPYDPDEPGAIPADLEHSMETARRENYDSGEDFVLEYGELRFTFNEADFSERCEQAALKLGFVGGRPRRGGARRPRQPRRQRRDPRARLGTGRTRQRLLARARRPRRALARALAAAPRVPRRLARPARQGGRADVGFDEQTGTFAYVQRRPAVSAGEPIELAPEPSWGRVAYRGRRAADDPPRARLLQAPRARSCAPWRSPRRRLADEQLGLSVPLLTRSRIGWRRRGRLSSAITVVSPPSGWAAVAITVSEPPSRRLRAAASALARGVRAEAVEAVDQHHRVAAARRDALGARRSRARSPVPASPSEAAKLSAAAGRARALLPLGDLLGPRAGQHEAHLEPLASRERVEQAAQRLGLARAARRRRSPRASRVRAA